MAKSSSLFKRKNIYNPHIHISKSITRIFALIVLLTHNSWGSFIIFFIMAGVSLGQSLWEKHY